MMLTGYIAGLTAYYNKCEENEGKNKARSLHKAEQGLAAFREAETQRKAGDPDLADASVDRALLRLQERYDRSSTSYQSFLTLSSAVQEQRRISTDLVASWRTGTILKLGRHSQSCRVVSRQCVWSQVEMIPYSAGPFFRFSGLSFLCILLFSCHTLQWSQIFPVVLSESEYLFKERIV